MAYIVEMQEQETADSTGTLQSFIHRKLPDYMIPHVFITLDTMPLTPQRQDRPSGTGPGLARR